MDPVEIADRYRTAAKGGGERVQIAEKFHGCTAVGERTGENVIWSKIMGGRDLSVNRDTADRAAGT